MVLASKSHQCKKRVRKQRKKIHFFSLFFNKRQELTLYFTYIYIKQKKDMKTRTIKAVSDGAVREIESE
jgi:hypothetical protein